MGSGAEKNEKAGKKLVEEKLSVSLYFGVEARVVVVRAAVVVRRCGMCMVGDFFGWWNWCFGRFL